MKGEALEALRVQIYREILLYPDARIVLVEPSCDEWPSLTLANHNVFRLDAEGQVVWQVRREDMGHMNWDYLNKEAKAEDPDIEGYFDPFNRLYMLDCPTMQTGEARSRVWQPGCKVYLNTRWWAYLLDIDTGIATCTGEQVK